MGEKQIVRDIPLDACTWKARTLVMRCFCYLDFNYAVMLRLQIKPERDKNGTIELVQTYFKAARKYLQGVVIHYRFMVSF